MSKLVQFKTLQIRQSIGVVSGDELMDIGALAENAPKSMLEWLRLAEAERMRLIQLASTSGKRIPLQDIEFLPAVTGSEKVICLGLNYADHAAEGGNARPDYPSFFLRSPGSLVGHGCAILLPHVSTKLDFEAELAVVIGQRSRYLTDENALQAVAGYACFNDATLRDYQRRSSQWTIGKNFDNTGAFGPFLVEARDLPAGAAGLKIESRLNGAVMQSSNTSNMLFPVAETLRLITEVMTLEVGDVVVMGTPAGVGYARTPPIWMQPGDSVVVEIEGIGVLTNPIEQDTRKPGQV
ncbi:MAG: fumarylacetoacetate hydrolase family protein [Pseudomonadota bacterium]